MVVDPVLVLGPVALVLVSATGLLVYLGRTAAKENDLVAELAAARRHSLATGVCATGALWLIGVVLWSYLLLAREVDGSRLVAVAPLLGAMTGLVILLAGEATWPRPRGRFRSAILRPRTMKTLISRPWLAGTGASAVALLLLVTWAGFAADASGRNISSQSGGGLSQSAFPGWFYGLPQLVMLGITAVLVWGVARIASTRPAVVTADASRDDVLRRASIVRALRLTTGGTLLCLTGDLHVAGHALSSPALGTGSWSLGDAALALSLLMSVAAVAALLVPAPRMPARGPARARARGIKA